MRHHYVMAIELELRSLPAPVLPSTVYAIETYRDEGARAALPPATAGERSRRSGAFNSLPLRRMVGHAEGRGREPLVT